ncbi:unnamed protein product, partial [Penicillium discolor]
VLCGGAGAAGERVQLLLAGSQRERELLEQHGALVERELAERGLTGGAGEVERRAEVETGGGDAGDRLPGRGVAHLGGVRPDDVGEPERSHRVLVAEGHGRVDVGRGGDAVLEHPDRLEAEGDAQT